ncbi:MAG: DUF126 domain-containing protein [Bacillota bacterium]|nr:DUF126 domain-containing protein [Bacillota bacterium]
MSETYKCKKISPGKIQGQVILSKDAVCFYLVEPKTGVVKERDHDLEGQSIAGKILIMPSGKGSSVVQADGLYKLAQNDKSPIALVIEHADTVLVTSAIILDVPMVHKVDPTFYNKINDGDTIILDATEGCIEILNK